MATIGNINVAITASTRGIDKGLSDANRKLSAFGNQQRKTQRAAAGGGGGRRGRGGGGADLGFLRGGVAGTIASVLGIKQLSKAADQWTELNNRVKIVTDSTEEQESTVKSLFGVAERARVSVGAVAGTFQKFALVNRLVGVSNERTARMVETLAKLGTIGGQTTEAINQGLRQMAQGFGKNKLDGDELRSVIENLLPVAQEIAKTLGTDIAGLQGKKGFGAKGKITQDIIRQSLENARARADLQFAELTPTISQELQVLSDKWTKLVGRINEATGATKKFALVTGELGKFLDATTTFVEKPSIDAINEIAKNKLLRTFGRGPAGLLFSAVELAFPERFGLEPLGGEVKETNSDSILRTLKGLPSEIARFNQELNASRFRGAEFQ